MSLLLHFDICTSLNLKSCHPSLAKTSKNYKPQDENYNPREKNYKPQDKNYKSQVKNYKPRSGATKDSVSLWWMATSAGTRAELRLAARTIISFIFQTSHKEELRNICGQIPFTNCDRRYRYFRPCFNLLLLMF